MKLVVCDLASIEYNIVGWLARCRAITECVRDKRDAYLNFAPALYPTKPYNYKWLKEQYDAKNVEIENVRQMAKPPVLGGGFGLGGGELIVNEFGDTVRSGMWGYALNVCGVDMPRELAHAAVETYRKVNWEVPILWSDLEQAFKQVLKHGTPITVGHVTWNKKSKKWNLVRDNFTGAMITFYRAEMPKVGTIIRMKLPSGRFLHYLNCRIEEEEFQYADKKTGEKKTAIGEVIYYDGIEHSAITEEDGSVSKKAQKWGKTKTYGGKLTENAVQAIARDILVNGCHLATEMGFKIFGVFHDEIGALVDNTSWDIPTLDDLRFCMSQPPKWAPTMILDAAGYVSQFYKKG